jgi:small subunit ribosomal protein S8
MDPISDLLAQIRNAQQRFHKEIQVPHSKLKAQICRVLKEEGYIGDYRLVIEEGRAILQITLKYKGKRGKEPVITGLKRISTPGRRVYVGVEAIPLVRNGLGTAILSTPRGVMTGKQARQLRVGGELLAQVW